VSGRVLKKITVRLGKADAQAYLRSQKTLAAQLREENDTLRAVLKKAEYASRKDSLTITERLESVRAVLSAALTREGEAQ